MPSTRQKIGQKGEMLRGLGVRFEGVGFGDWDGEVGFWAGKGLRIGLRSGILGCRKGILCKRKQ